MNTVAEVAIEEGAPPFSNWDTPKLGQMIRLTRQRLAEAQAKFAESGAAERRLRKHMYESEEAEQHVRRVEDDLELMRDELRRRAIGAFVERRKGERKGIEFRRSAVTRVTAEVVE